MGYSQKGAAEALGLKRRVVQYYEKGERDGERVSIPKAVRLACYALETGITDYHGPEPKPDPAFSTEPAPPDQGRRADQRQRDPPDAE